jgi:hypothetical protein
MNGIQEAQREDQRYAQSARVEGGTKKTHPKSEGKKATAPRRMHGQTKDLTGLRFGKLSVIRMSDERMGARKKIGWECLCDCGNTKVILGKA